MSDKSQNLDAVQLNDADLDQVVGGQEVLSLQMMGTANEGVAGGCFSNVSCESSQSCKSSTSSAAVELEQSL